MITGYSNYTEMEMVLFAHWKQKIETVYARHGFTPFTIRPVENLEDLRKKGGVNNQIFSINQIQNKNEAKLGLPFDRTVPMALWVNQYAKEITYPLKRSDVNYSFRGEKPQAGRFRAFYQADVDIVDTKINRLAEAECIATMFEALNSLNIGQFIMFINNMKISKALARSVGISEENMEQFLQIIDKLEKMSKEQIINEIIELDSTLDLLKIENVLELYAYKGPIEGFVISEEIKNSALEAFNELSEIILVLSKLGIDTDSISFSPCMVRGLNYYTGVVFETFLVGGRQYGSIASGGRYDNLLEGLGGKTPLEGVGGSIGLTRLFDVCVRNNIAAPSSKSYADVMVTYRDPVHELLALDVVKQLRDSGLKVDLYSGCATNVTKKLNYANKKNIRYVIIVMDQNCYVVKDLVNREQSEMTEATFAVENLISRLEEKQILIKN